LSSPLITKAVIDFVRHEKGSFGPRHDDSARSAEGGGLGEAAVRVHHPAFDCLPADRLDRLSLDQLFRKILNLITPIGGEARCVQNCSRRFK
jgi:hypothetical protein